MSKELWIPLIALAGVLLSAVVSLLISRNAIGTELRKLRFEAKKTYDSKLLDRRIEVYPSLYSILSKFIKELRDSPPSKDMVKSLLTQVDDWDSRHAVYFSTDTGMVCYAFRKHLNELCKLKEEEFLKRFSTKEAVKELRDETASLEFALKSDLGIYGIEDSDDKVYEPKFVNSYTQISKSPKVGRLIDKKMVKLDTAPNKSVKPTAR